MNSFQSYARNCRDPEQMATEYLKKYFKGGNRVYPINPFQMLKDEGILFSIRPFDKLEGVYLPAGSKDDIAVVGINLKRPITRQRFTAAHELCHHFRDADKEIACPLGKKDAIEQYADKFAAALLMPIDELRLQVDSKKVGGYVDFGAVLEIADYFGVSFDACVRRIAYRLHAIDGDVESKALSKRISKFAPDKRRRELGMDNVGLYEGLIDAYGDALAFIPDDHSRNVFQNEYIYNDSRMEGMDVSIEEASEIVTDLRLQKQNSQYCVKENEAFMSVAGHYVMYQEIFKLPLRECCSVFDMVGLNRNLFSCYPCPEYGGSFRQLGTLVMGAKFETVPCEQVIPELLKIETEVKAHFENREKAPLSEYLKKAFELHHRLTVIHPFADGNGRTLRAFLNVQLVRSNVTPLYIKFEEKADYVEALGIADTTGNYNPLYELMFKVVLRSCAELSGWFAG